MLGRLKYRLGAMMASPAVSADLFRLEKLTGEERLRFHCRATADAISQCLLPCMGHFTEHRGPVSGFHPPSIQEL